MATQATWSVPSFGRVRTLVTGLGILGLLLTSTGCGVERLLRADFNEYASPPVGAGLNGPLPGVPEGDRIENVAAGVNLVEDAVGIDGWSMRIDGGTVDFVPADHDTPDEYEINWRGFREYANNSGGTTVAFIDDDGEEAFEMFFDGEGGDVHYIEGGGSELYDLVSNDHPHDFTVILHMDVRRVSVRFQELTAPFPSETTGLFFIDDGFDVLDRIRIQADSDGQYHIADLDVWGRSD
jgi:hypothetical protein